MLIFVGYSIPGQLGLVHSGQLCNRMAGVEINISNLLAHRTSVIQSSKDSTSPMSETCKIRTGHGINVQDRKPDWACKIVESKLNEHIGQNKDQNRWNAAFRLKSSTGADMRDPFNQRRKIRVRSTVPRPEHHWQGYQSISVNFRETADVLWQKKSPECLV